MQSTILKPLQSSKCHQFMQALFHIFYTFSSLTVIYIGFSGCLFIKAATACTLDGAFQQEYLQYVCQNNHLIWNWSGCKCLKNSICMNQIIVFLSKRQNQFQKLIYWDQIDELISFSCMAVRNILIFLLEAFQAAPEQICCCK